MSLQKKLSASEIVREAGMSARPGFYSGRGATNSDVNDKIWEKVYQVINNFHGEDAANQYAQMVADISKLSATDFLLTLYRLESNDWEWDKKLSGSEKGIYPDSEGSAWGTIGEVLCGGHERDETYNIRGQFLRRHNIQTEDKISNNNPLFT